MGKTNNIISTDLLQPQDGRIWITQKPWNTWPKIPWNAISSTVTSMWNITTGNVTPVSNNSKNLWTSSLKRNTVYATTLNASTLAMGAITITSSSSVTTAAIAQTDYINITINWVTYKLLLWA